MSNNFISFYGNFINYTGCTSSSLIDNILYLISPKMLESQIEMNQDRSKNNSLLTTDTIFVNSTNSNHKFDKKTKNYTKIQDVLDLKKSKSKLSKRSRKIVDLDSSEKLIKSNNVILNEDILNLEVIKAPRQKKKNKLKNDNDINRSDNNNIINISNVNKENSCIVLNKPLAIQDLSKILDIPAAEIITYLFLKGISVTMNQVVDISIAKDVASHYEILVQDNDDAIIDNANNINVNDSFVSAQNRPPIVTILGHVDHGKTTLLDSILNTNLVSKEYGGITQSIMGYEVDWYNKESKVKLVFVDTPGHDAFIAMRSRGIQITDIALLIVAADDGLKPQTIEAIEHILVKKIPYIVVINKVDKDDINIIRIKEELATYNILDQEWGGDAIILEVSALKNINIDLLLSNICDLSKKQNLQYDSDQLAKGLILETYLDKKSGIIANLVVQNGVIQVGDYLVSGNIYCKIKNILNYKNQSIKRAEASSIIKILGFSSMPVAGIAFEVVSDETQAKINVSSNIDSMSQSTISDSLNRRVTLDFRNTKVKLLNLILRTDTQGSLEAIITALSQISQEKVQLNVLSSGSGNISNNDIDLASASSAVVLGFNMNMSSNIVQKSKNLGVLIKTFNVIYELLDYIENSMLNLIDPEFDEIFLGRAIVQTVFNMNKGSVAGCLVQEGKLIKDSNIYVYRDNKIVSQCILTSLKRIKEDVTEVKVDTECGIMCSDYNLWKQNDIIEAYNLVEKQKAL